MVREQRVGKHDSAAVHDKVDLVPEGAVQLVGEIGEIGEQLREQLVGEQNNGSRW